MSAKRSKSTKELLKAARLPERHISICLRGDLVADIEAKERELAQALHEGATNKRVGTKSKAKQLAEDIEAMRAEMGEAMLSLRLRALKTTEWRDLLRKHPPAKGSNQMVDLLPFMGEAIPLSVIEPDDMDADDWQTLNDNAPASEMTKLMNAVWEMNTESVDIPKSPLASVLNRRSGEGSK